MEWLRTHPYTTALGGACMLVIIGAIFVVRASATPAPSGVSAWSGNVANGSYASSGAYGTVTQASSENAPPSASQYVYATGTLPYNPATAPVADSVGTLPSGAATSSFDFNSFLASISHPTPAVSATGNDTGASAVNAWSYVPSGLIATSTGLVIGNRTASQEALYTYGNEIGSYIEGYDAAHAGQAQVLSDAMNDRQSAAKTQAVARIGHDLQTVATGIGETTDVPANASSTNAALAASYEDMGAKLIDVATAMSGSDASLVSAIEAYDSAVNDFNSRYIALSNLFSVSGVTFSQNDPGSVFSFNATTL